MTEPDEIRGMIGGRGSRMRLRCGRCGHSRDHIVGEPLPPCPGACGATESGVLLITGQSDAEHSAPIRDAIAESEARRQALIASGMNRHERRRQAAMERAKETR